MPSIIGYARTSTTDQAAGLEAQHRELEAFGADRVYSEQASSIGRRKQLDAALDYLRKGDTLVVTKPDRLARSTGDLLSIVEGLTARHVGLVVLSMGGAILDTRNPTSKLMLTILASVAAWEREIMLERQREGIAKARAEGKYRGRPPSISPQDVATLREQGLGPAAIGKRLGIARSSVYRMLEQPLKPH